MQTNFHNIIPGTVELVEQCEEYLHGDESLLLKTPQTTVLKTLDVQEK